MDADLPEGDPPLPIRFFKIILKTNLETIKIPNKFTRRYGDGMSNPVFLKPPDGTEWKVHWTKENGELWLEKGWTEFTENYSLDHGDLLLFKYEGTSQIEVDIVDQSNLEMDYLSYDNCEEWKNLDQSDDEWEDQKARQKPPIPSVSAQPHKKMRDEKAIRRSLSLNWPKEPRAREIAKNFTSESDNPFFTKYIKHAHVMENQLNVPNLDGYIENKKKDVILQLGNRSWNVNMLSSHNLYSRRITVGWSLFARESELQSGDICIFELIKRDDIVFKVHVFKSQN